MPITFKPLKKHHFTLLLKWLQSPHTKARWNDNTTWTRELIEDKYHTYVDGYTIENGHCKKIYAYIIEYENKPIGYIQYYNAYDVARNLPLDGLPRSLATIDFFIGEQDYCGKGIGSQAFYLFLKKYIDFRFEYCFVDPENDNRAAIRVYEKSGFVQIQEDENHKQIWMIRPSKLIIRKATSKDTKKLERLFQITRQKAFVFQLPHTFKIGDYTESVKDDEVWVAQQDKTIVGFVSIRRADNFIHNLFVHHAFQGRGIGKRLLSVAEKNLSHPITLKTVLDNFKARQFYENQGYKKLSIHKTNEAEEFYVVYKKDLA